MKKNLAYQVPFPGFRERYIFGGNYSRMRIIIEEWGIKVEYLVIEKKDTLLVSIRIINKNIVFGHSKLTHEV